MRPRHERLAEQTRLTELIPAAKAELMRHPGVLDVGVGLKETNDRATDTTAFRVYVAVKRPLSELAESEIIPEQVLGVATDVVLEAAPRETVDDDKYRPMLGGIMIGNDSGSLVGTLGCLAQRNSDQSIVLLGNQHVMLDGGASNGEKIGQPTISCCCCCKGNIVGEVVDSAFNGLVDCAIARINGQPGFTNEIHEIGLIFGSAPLNSAGSTVVFGDKVRKRGCSTGLTTGTVMNARVGTSADAATGRPARTDQIEIKPDPEFESFQSDGDSGAALVNDENVVVGLMWGAHPTTKMAYANRITDVVSALNITILNSGTAGTIPLGGASYTGEVPAVDAADAPLHEIAAALQRSADGRRMKELFDRHANEMNALLNTVREVKVAWHRFQGPAFTAHFIQSAREREHAIPANIEGVTPANLLIRMSVVLQDHGSTELAAAVEANTLPLLELVGKVNSVHQLLDRFTWSNDSFDMIGASAADTLTSV